jgi:hypothetical protein
VDHLCKITVCDTIVLVAKGDESGQAILKDIPKATVDRGVVLETCWL